MDTEMKVSELVLTERENNREQTRNTASKYDFVKVKVYLGKNLHHYYVLSRYLISRMLTVTMIPNTKAVKIALEVKKHLVDHGLFDVSQEQLEAIIFKLMHSRGFGNEFVKRYKMVTEFFQQRRPLIILICGVICTGKSTIAQQLASRLNLPNVLQTDVIYELLHRQDEEGPLHEEPLWKREDLDEGRLLGEYQRECRVVRKGVNGDLVKCIRDGKSIIMEGLHLDPGLYLYEFGRYGLQHLQEAMNAPNGGSELALSPRLLTAETETGHAAPSINEAVGPDHRASASKGDAGAQAEKLDAASNGRESRNGEPDQDVASVRAAWKARRYSSSASFMLSSSNSSMQPRITSGSDAELAALPSRLKASTQEVAGARHAPASPAKFASSPAAEWLAKMEAASSIFHLRQGRSPHSTEECPPQGLPEAPKLSRRSFGKLPSAPAWLSRSRQLFRTAKEPVVAKALVDSKDAKAGDEARRANGEVGDAVKAAGGLEKATTSSHGSDEEFRQPANAGQSPHQAATSEQASGMASQLEDRGTLDLDKQSIAGVVHEAQHDGPQLPPSVFQNNSAPDGGVSQPGSLQRRYVSEGQPATADMPVSHLNLQPDQAFARSSSQKAKADEKALASSTPGKEPIPAATPQILERRSHSVRFDLRPSVEKPLPSKLHVRPDGNAMQTESLAARDTGQRDAAAATVSNQAAGSAVKGAEKGLDGGPVFVPIVMSMAEQDHVLLVEEWYSRQQGIVQANTGGDTASLGLAGVQTRLQALQKHLCSYAASSVPVVHTDLANMGTTLDKLHNYLLQCIAISMGQA